jgi:hypothetical protein
MMGKHVTFPLFLICLFSCAALVLFFIWNDGPPSDVWMQAAATLFVIGLGSFLLWFVATILEIRDKIADR